MTKRMTVVAALAFFMPCLAFATGVSYTTVGSAGVSGTTFITYNAVSASVGSTPATGAPLGSVSFSCATTCPFTGASLSLTITQTLPGSGSGPLTATLTGFATLLSNGGVFITWGGPVTITALGYQTTYTPTTTFTCVGFPTCTGLLLVDITQVKIPTVPEPNAQLLLGLGSLGLMGLAIVSRKMITG